jgi:hypothetical protein
VNIAIFDPVPMGNEYFTKMFAAPVRAYAAATGVACSDLVTLSDVRNATVVLLTDHLTEERILQLKNNGNKIVGFNVTDSAYISGAIRFAKSLSLVDLVFMLSGVQRCNKSRDWRLTENFEPEMFDKPFLPDETWGVFDYMRRAGRLQSLPYVPWTPLPDLPREPYGRRSQKVILRGGGHARRFILALFLDRLDLLDPNSGFVLFPYFADDMNPQFRYCDRCRSEFKKDHRYAYLENGSRRRSINDCTSPARNGTAWDLSDLGQWNNRCPESFFWMAEQFARHHGPVDMDMIESMLNARWLHPTDHMRAMSRIAFTSDIKWMHSIYAPQRFWEAAAAGCINVLPARVTEQDYFPHISAGMHYLMFEEPFENLKLAFTLDEGSYNEMAGETRRLYEQWIAPTVYPVNTNLLAHIFGEMEKL